MPAFQILKEKLPEGVILLTVRGFLDAHTFEELERTINDIFEEGTYKLVVDLSGLDYISSAGAGVFTINSNIVGNATADNIRTGYTLSAASSGSTGATSKPFSIFAAPPHHLVFAAQPSNAVAGVAIAPPVVVAVQLLASVTVYE